MDDEEIVRDVGVQLLETIGYQVELAVNGEEAVSLYMEAIKTKARFQHFCCHEYGCTKNIMLLNKFILS